MNKFMKDIFKIVIKNYDVSNFKNKTVLITGANGLIGGFLTDFFCHLNESYNYNMTLVLTSLSDKPERLVHLLDYSYVNYIQKDLSIADWSNFNEKIDYCFYCAGYAQPGKFLSNPSKTFSLNTIGVNNTFENIFKNNKTAKCLFISSSEVYVSNENKKPHHETDTINLILNHKRNSYIMGKLSGEFYTNCFKKLGFDAKSARVSLCYGPGHVFGDSRVMSDLVKKAMRNDYIQLFDDGISYRKYQNISDCCIMLFNILLNGEQEVYNVGGKEETTIYDMAKMIGNKFNKEVKKGKINNDISNSAPKKVSLSLNRYEEEFNKFDFMSFKDGIENYLNWYKEEYKNEI